MLFKLCQWLENTPVAHWISESDFGFVSIETVHVLALTAVVGTISVVDLRLLNLASRHRTVLALSTEVLPITWGAFVVAVISGGLLFATKATQYIDNIPFLLKMLGLALAGVNMFVFHHFSYRKVENWDAEAAHPHAASIAAVLSLALWTGVIVCGRWIGFTTH